MKIFSNFDTKRKVDAYAEMVEKYGTENVLVLNKSFLFFIVKVLFPVIWGFIAVFLLRAIIFFSMDGMVEVQIIFSVFMVLLYGFLLTISSVVKYYIDYRMDFSIVTPEYLTRYNQTGFLKRDVKSSYLRNIKTISVIKNKFIYNIFNNGDLIFVSDSVRSWWKGDSGEIILHYIQNPEEKRKKITKIMKDFN